MENIIDNTQENEEFINEEEQDEISKQKNKRELQNKVLNKLIDDINKENTEQKPTK